jgi:hypothetical protein
VPNAAPVSLSAVTGGFESDFEKFFNAKAQEVPEAQEAQEETWAHVVHTETSSPTVQSVSGAAPSVPSAPRAPIAPLSLSAQRLPTLDMLQRPEELLRTLSPHLLIVDVKSNGGIIVVQCSHQPSLELLAGYLQKWGRKNTYNNRWVSRVRWFGIDIVV